MLFCGTEIIQRKISCKVRRAIPLYEVQAKPAVDARNNASPQEREDRFGRVDRPGVRRSGAKSTNITTKENKYETSSFSRAGNLRSNQSQPAPFAAGGRSLCCSFCGRSGYAWSRRRVGESGHCLLLRHRCRRRNERVIRRAC